MNSYEIYKHPILGIEVIKQGFSWPAFFFGWLWALYKKLWIIATVFIVAFLFISIISEAIIGYRIDPDEALGSLILYLIPMLIMGFKGNEWQRASMKKRGYELVLSIEADSADGALSKTRRKSGVEGAEEETPSISVDDAKASQAMYEIISNEIDKDRVNHALWMQSLEQSSGDSNKQKAIYLKLRSSLFKQNLRKANLDLKELQNHANSSDDPPCDRDLLSDVYKIWLMVKYSIDRRQSSGGFYHSGKTFTSLNKSIAFAHVLDKQESEKRKEVLARQQQVEQEEKARKQVEANALAEQRKEQQQKAKELRRKRMPWFAVASLLFVIVIGIYAWKIESEYRVDNSRYVKNVSLAETELSRVIESVNKLNEKITSLKKRRSQLVISNYLKLSGIGNKLKNSQLENVSVTLTEYTDDSSVYPRYYATVHNNSDYHIGKMSGELTVYSNGIVWKRGIYMNLQYTINSDEWKKAKVSSLAPGASIAVINSSGEKDDYGGIYLWLNSVVKSKLSRKKRKKIAISKGIGEMVVLDSKVDFKGNIVFVTKPILDENGGAYFTTPIDFAQLIADEHPELSKISGLQTIKTELSDLESRMADLERDVKNKQLALNKVKGRKPFRNIF